MAASRYIVYALTNPLNGEVRYIGKSSSALARAKTHDRTNDDLPVHRWAKKLRSTGLRYGILVLEDCAKEDLVEAERAWIAIYLAMGASLLNLTLGGEGSYGYKQTLGHIESRISKCRGLPRPPEQRQRMKEAKAHLKRPRCKAKQASGGVRPGAPAPRAIQDDLGNIFSSVGEASKYYVVDRAHIRRVLQGKKISAVGRTFSYVNQEAS